MSSKAIRLAAGALIFLTVLVSCSSQKNLPQVVTGEQLFNILDNREFQFHATYVVPTRGGQRDIAGDGYTLTVRKDRVDSYLPYFGRGRQAPIDPTNIGIKFNSADFQYASETGNDGRRLIVIKPNDVADIPVLNLTVFSNGSADIRVTSNSKESIAYRGFVTPLPETK